MSEAKIQGVSVMEYLEKQGATKSQLTAGVIPMIIDGMTDEEISKSATMREQVDLMKERIEQAGGEAHRVDKHLQEVKKQYREITELLEQAEISVSERMITDPKLVDGVNAFMQMLESVRDVFGTNNMTESVICAAINAASYGYWRSIMGGKHPDEQRNRERGRL